MRKQGAPPFDERFVGYGKNKIQWIQHLRTLSLSLSLSLTEPEPNPEPEPKPEPEPTPTPTQVGPAPAAAWLLIPRDATVYARKWSGVG